MIWDTQAAMYDLCGWFGQLGLGDWSATAPYSKVSPNFAIYADHSDEGRDRATCLIKYGDDFGDHPEDANTALYQIQVWNRVKRTDTRWVAHRQADRVFDSINHAEAVTLPGGTYVHEVHRTITGEIDRDEAGRFFRADSYAFLLNRGESAT